MLKLYGGERSRASIVRWYLEELQVPYEFVLLDMAAQEHLQPEFRKINPFSKVPAVQVENSSEGIANQNFSLWESGAILLYLTERYGKEFQSAEDRAVIAQWVLFANATLGPGVFVEASRERELPRLMQPLNEILEHQPFLLGDRFSAADVAVGSMAWYMPLMLKIDLSGYPAISKYIQRLSERPAFQKAMGGR